MTATCNFDGGSNSLLQPAPLTAAEEHAARLIVASCAADVEDCANLLDMLGLRPTEGEVTL